MSSGGQRRFRALPLALLSVACASTSGVPPTTQPDTSVTGWQAIVTPADRRRLRDWRTAFVEGVRQAHAAGFGPRLASQGALLRPDIDTPDPTMPPGPYRCRTFKLGSQGGGTLAYVAYPVFACRVDARDGPDGLVKLTGSQRPVGLIYGDGAGRDIFLGTLALGDETSALAYGRDAERDVAGFINRVDARCWRLVLPYPRFESVVDVVEMCRSAGDAR